MYIYIYRYPYIICTSEIHVHVYMYMYMYFYIHILCVFLLFLLLVFMYSLARLKWDMVYVTCRMRFLPHVAWSDLQQLAFFNAVHIDCFLAMFRCGLCHPLEVRRSCIERNRSRAASSVGNGISMFKIFSQKICFCIGVDFRGV